MIDTSSSAPVVKALYKKDDPPETSLAPLGNPDGMVEDSIRNALTGPPRLSRRNVIEAGRAAMEVAMRANRRSVLPA